MTSPEQPAAQAGAAGAAVAVEHLRIGRGVLFLLATVSIFPISDSIAKLLTAEVPVVQIVWAKLVIQTLVVGPLVLARSGVESLKSRQLPLQVGRSLLLLFSMTIFVTALSFIPLAVAISVLYVSPVIVTALSVPLLGERVGVHRWTAVAVGFMGAMIVIRPGLGVLHWATMLPLVAACASALFQISTRRLAVTDPPMTTLLYTTLGGGVVSSLFVGFWWVPLTMEQWGLLAVVGIIGAISSYLMIRAFECAPASVLAPIGYAEILTASLAGYVVFGYVPDRWTAIGAAIIAASGLYITYRESRQRMIESSASALPPPL